MDTDERSRAIVLAHMPTYIKGDRSGEWCGWWQRAGWIFRRKESLFSFAILFSPVVTGAWQAGQKLSIK